MIRQLKPLVLAFTVTAQNTRAVAVEVARLVEVVAAAAVLRQPPRQATSSAGTWRTKEAFSTIRGLLTLHIAHVKKNDCAKHITW